MSDRRQFITGGAAGVAAAVAGAETQAVSQLNLLATARRASVVLHDPRIPMPAEVQQRLGANGASVVTLDGDPVWFWRSAAGAALRDPSAQLLGVTGWADLLVFRGLAAETRRHLRYEKLSGSGTFVWLIA
jgi:hypothetical protein